MKIAISLNGLILDKVKILPHIKTMFNLFAERNGVEIDYYCHFWNDNGLYPYEFNDSDSQIVLPKEYSMQQALDIIQPIEYTVSNFNECMPHFLNYYSRKDNNDWEKNISEIIQNKQFEHNIHSRFFIDNYPDRPEDAFDKWWFIHVAYCQFIHMISQPFSISKCCNMILKSGKEYDACIRWRYDVVADLKTHNNKLIQAIEECQDKNVFYTELAWEGLNWKEDIPYDINTAPDDKIISLHDGWWISSHLTNNRLAKNLLPYYIDSFVNRVFAAQHVHFYDAIRRNGCSIGLLDRIQHAIIRFPDTLPPNYNDRPELHYVDIYNSNFVVKRNSLYKDNISQWGRRAQYHIAKDFVFYN